MGAWGGPGSRRSIHGLKRAETHRHDFPGLQPLDFVLVDDHQLLGVGHARRHHHAAAGLELVDQQRWNQLRRRGDHDAVIGRALGPAVGAVADTEFDASNQLSEIGA